MVVFTICAVVVVLLAAGVRVALVLPVQPHTPVSVQLARVLDASVDWVDVHTGDREHRLDAARRLLALDPEPTGFGAPAAWLLARSSSDLTERLGWAARLAPTSPKGADALAGAVGDILARGGPNVASAVDAAGMLAPARRAALADLLAAPAATEVLGRPGAARLAERLSPSADTANRVGVALDQTWNPPDEALLAFQRAHTLDPGNPVIAANLASARYRRSTVDGSPCPVILQLRDALVDAATNLDAGTAAGFRQVAAA
jgi:hypothetical protein